MEVKKILPPTLILALFLAGWSIGARVYDMPFLLPGPWLVAKTFKTEFEIIMQGLGITFSAAFTGYVIAIVIGITVATVMSLSKILELSLIHI